MQPRFVACDSYFKLCIQLLYFDEPIWMLYLSMVNTVIYNTISHITPGLGSFEDTRLKHLLGFSFLNVNEQHPGFYLLFVIILEQPFSIS